MKRSLRRVNDIKVRCDTGEARRLCYRKCSRCIGTRSHARYGIDIHSRHICARYEHRCMWRSGKGPGPTDRRASAQKLQKLEWRIGGTEGGGAVRTCVSTTYMYIPDGSVAGSKLPLTCCPVGSVQAPPASGVPPSTWYIANGGSVEHTTIAAFDPASNAAFATTVKTALSVQP